MASRLFYEHTTASLAGRFDFDPAAYWEDGDGDNLRASSPTRALSPARPRTPSGRALPSDYSAADDRSVTSMRSADSFQRRKSRTNRNLQQIDEKSTGAPLRSRSASPRKTGTTKSSSGRLTSPSLRSLTAARTRSTSRASTAPRMRNVTPARRLTKEHGTPATGIQSKRPCRPKDSQTHGSATKTSSTRTAPSQSRSTPSQSRSTPSQSRSITSTRTPAKPRSSLATRSSTKSESSSQKPSNKLELSMGSKDSTSALQTKKPTTPVTEDDLDLDNILNKSQTPSAEGADIAHELDDILGTHGAKTGTHGTEKEIDDPGKVAPDPSETKEKIDPLKVSMSQTAPFPVVVAIGKEEEAPKSETKSENKSETDKNPSVAVHDVAIYGYKEGKDERDERKVPVTNASHQPRSNVSFPSDDHKQQEESDDKKQEGNGASGKVDTPTTPNYADKPLDAGKKADMESPVLITPANDKKPDENNSSAGTAYLEGLQKDEKQKSLTKGESKESSTNHENEEPIDKSLAIETSSTVALKDADGKTLVATPNDTKAPTLAETYSAVTPDVSCPNLASEVEKKIEKNMEDSKAAKSEALVEKEESEVAEHEVQGDNKHILKDKQLNPEIQAQQSNEDSESNASVNETVRDDPDVTTSPDQHPESNARRTAPLKKKAVAIVDPVVTNDPSEEGSASSRADATMSTSSKERQKKGSGVFQTIFKGEKGSSRGGHKKRSSSKKNVRPVLISCKYNPSRGFTDFQVRKHKKVWSAMLDYEKAKLDAKSVAKIIIEELFERDFWPGKHWEIDSARVWESTGSEHPSFNAEKLATWDWKDIYSEASATAVIRFLPDRILIENYAYYVAG